MASVNDIFYEDGSIILLQSTGESPTVFYEDGGLYIVHEYVATGGETTLITALAFKYFQMMRKNR